MGFVYDKLKGRIKERFGTQDEFAKSLGMSRTSLSLKLNNASEFTQKEMLKAMSLLEFPRAEFDAYFFTQDVRKTELKIEKAR